MAPVTRAAVAARPGTRVLDLAAGTGTSSVEYAADGAEVVACDFSTGMVAEGKRRHPEIAFVAGDATALPFADESFASSPSPTGCATCRTRRGRCRRCAG